MLFKPTGLCEKTGRRRWIQFTVRYEVAHAHAHANTTGYHAHAQAHPHANRPTKQMWLKRYVCWIRDVVWLGPLAPKVPGSDGKHTSHPMLRHFEKERERNHIINIP